MTHKKTPGGEYEVGYGKPPKQHQFKPGHTKSKGPRRKRRQSLSEIIDDVLLQIISLGTKGGKRRMLRVARRAS